MEISPASSQEEIDDCFLVMAQLRTHLTFEAYRKQVQAQFDETGYRLAYVRTEAGVQAVAGFIVRHLLAAGMHIHAYHFRLRLANDGESR